MMDGDIGFKHLLVDAVCGVGFPSVILAGQCEQAGMARFVGGTTWEWRRERLMKCQVIQLQELYQALCEARQEVEDAAFAEPEQPSLILEA